MTVVKVAAVQASYVLMDREATITKVDKLTAEAAAQGVQLLVFPELFVPGTPLWIDTRPIWDGDDDWFRLLFDQAVVLPGPDVDRLAEIAASHGVWLVIGVSEREAHTTSLYNTMLYFSPQGELVDKHRKLVPAGSERTIYANGDGSTLRVVPTEHGRVGGLICYENFMPLARFHMYAQGVDIWVVPTLCVGDGWVGTMQHVARENRMFVIAANPVLHVDQIPADFPSRDKLVPAEYLEENGAWLEPGNSVVVGPSGALMAGPIREAEQLLIVEIDLADSVSLRRFIDPVGHYSRPDVFQLQVDVTPRQQTTTLDRSERRNAES